MAEPTKVYVLMSKVMILPAEYDDNNYTSNFYGGEVIGVYATEAAANKAKGSKSKLAYNVVKGSTVYDLIGSPSYDDFDGLFSDDLETVFKKLLKVFGPKRLQLEYHFKETPPDSEEFNADALYDMVSELVFPDDMTQAEWNKIKDLIDLNVSCYVVEKELQDA